MKAKVIRMVAHSISEPAAHQCRESARKFGIDMEYHSACLPSSNEFNLREQSFVWNYPWDGETMHCIKSGLIKRGYMTKNKGARIACFFSHYFLWKECVESGEDYLICEHDAVFTRPLDYNFSKTKKSIIALNQPQRGCTPSWEKYQVGVVSQVANDGKQRVVNIPYVNDDRRVPAGLPGNSAYYIKPQGAQALLNLCEEYGAWPNDAIMCNQLLPGKLGILYPYVTRVNQTISTTTA